MIKLRHKTGFFPDNTGREDNPFTDPIYYLEYTENPYQLISVEVESKIRKDLGEAWGDFGKNLIKGNIDEGTWVVFE